MESVTQSKSWVMQLSKKKIDDCLDFDTVGGGFLKRSAEEAHDKIKDLPQFVGAQVSLMPEDNQKKWKEKYSSHGSEQTITEIYESNKGFLSNPLKNSFQAASFHEQLEDTHDQLSAYPMHKDKIGKSVCFHEVEGYSYNLVAVQSRYLNSNDKVEEEVEEAQLEECYGYKHYQDYKNSLNKRDRSMVEKFESNFMKRATKEGQPRVYVYKMDPGDKLVFTASVYLHGTIVPKQDDGVRRALLVFHELIPY